MNLRYNLVTFQKIYPIFIGILKIEIKYIEMAHGTEFINTNLPLLLIVIYLFNYLFFFQFCALIGKIYIHNLNEVHTKCLNVTL
jgi:hypothetical protein